MVTIPNGSIYFWMYKQGLRHTDLHAIEIACASIGKEIRAKDYSNYWNGYYRSDLYLGPGADDIWMLSKHRTTVHESKEFEELTYTDYPAHPYVGMPEIGNRWVPCNSDNRPMIKWGNGCRTMADCVAHPGQKYLAENLKGTQMIVIDCDGNHDDPWDWETINFLSRYKSLTHCIEKPGYEQSPSFHLTFKVDRIIPTMHFPYAHIDIVGNRRNSLRYWKNKTWNQLQPKEMDPYTWDTIKDYIKYRKERSDNGNEPIGYAEQGSGIQVNQEGVRPHHA